MRIGNKQSAGAIRWTVFYKKAPPISEQSLQSGEREDSISV